MKNKMVVYLVSIFCIALPFFLLLLSFKTTLHFTELIPSQQEWMDYFDDKSEMPENYTEAEISHMQDVKKVLRSVEYLFYFLLLLISLIITYFYNGNKNRVSNIGQNHIISSSDSSNKCSNISRINNKDSSSKNMNDFKQLFKYGGITTVSFISLMLVIGIIAFNSLFTILHKVFFPQGNWQFPADSLLIQTFPYSFFFKMSIIIFLQTVFYGIFFIVLSYYLKNDNQSKGS